MDSDAPHVSFSQGAASGPLPISQIAIVVRDIDDALEKYHRVLGWGPWNVYEHKPPALHHTRLHGEPTEYTMIGAETHVGPIVVELLQPDEGPSIYKEWLDEHGEGLHHLCFGADDVPATLAELSDPGAPVVLGSGRGRVSGFLAAAGSHGASVELIEFVESDDVQAMPGWLDGRVS